MSKITQLLLVLILTSFCILSCSKDNGTGTGDGDVIPPKPTVIDAIGLQSEVALSFSEHDDLDSYTLYWDTASSVSKSSNAIRSIEEDAYRHTSLESGREYYYALTTIKEGTESELSPTVSALTLPDVPKGVQALAGDAQVQILFDTVSSATHYTLYWRTKEGSDTTSNRIDSITSGYKHTSLTNGTTYYYVLTAHNMSGASLISEEVSATPASGIYPLSAPVNVSATSGDKQITLSFDSVSNATYYTLYWDIKKGISKTSKKIDSINSGYVHSDLTNGTTYFYALCAGNKDTTSELSKEVSATPKELVIKPEIPTNVNALGGNKRVSLSWSSSSEVDRYEIFWDINSDVDTNAQKLSCTGTTFKHENVTNGTTYYYKVRAKNSAGVSDLSKEVNATPFDTTTVITIPQKLTVSSSNKKLSLGWDEVGNATGYNLYWSDSPGILKSNSTKIPLSTNSYVHSNVTNGKSYYYRVSATTSKGESDLSSEVTGVPQESSIESAIIEDILMKSGPSSVSFTWKKVEGATSYNVYRSTEEFFTKEEGIKESVTSNSYTHSGIKDTTTYFYRISAVDGANESLLSYIAHCSAGQDKLNWKYMTRGNSVSQTIIGDNGDIYFYGYDTHLYALHSDGSVKWKKKICDVTKECSTPSMGSDGTLYLSSSDKNVYAVDSETGDEVWRFATKGVMWTSPSIAADGTIYVSCLDNIIYALNPDGSEKWRFDKGHMWWRSVAIAKDGTIYAVCDNDSLYALNPDGTEKWQTYVYSGGTPAISPNGTIYIMGVTELYSIDSEGVLNWKRGVSMNNGGISITPEGKINFSYRLGNLVYRLRSINPDNSDEWVFDLDQTYGGCTIGKDGSIFITDIEKVYKLTSSGSEEWRFKMLDRSNRPIIGNDGSLYFGSNGFMYSLKTDCMGLADGGWPSPNYDLKNTKQQR